MLLVSLTDLHRSLIILQIILFLSQSQSALSESQNVLSSIHLIGPDVGSKKLRVAVRHHLKLDGEELLLGLRSLQALDNRHQRRQAILFPAGRVHCQLIEVAQFLLYSTFLIRILLQFLQDAIDTLVVVFGQTVKATIARISSRQRIGFHPSTTGILVKIITRTNALVEIRYIQT